MFSSKGYSKLADEENFTEEEKKALKMKEINNVNVKAEEKKERRKEKTKSQKKNGKLFLTENNILES